jgi:hypothetical protein
MSKPTRDPKQLLMETMLDELIKHVGGWIATLGSAGSPKNRKVNAQTRVTAAKTGIDLVMKLMGQSPNYDGEKLLGELEALTEQAEAGMDVDEDDEDAGE